MRIDLGETEIEADLRNKNSTEALLARLIQFHGDGTVKVSAGQFVLAPSEPAPSLPPPAPNVWFSISEIERKAPSIRSIQLIVAERYGVTRADLLSQRRTANVVKPRQIAMYLSKHLTPLSLPAIGRHFGGRDHTTALHAVNKIASLVQKDANLALEVKNMKEALAA